MTQHHITFQPLPTNNQTQHNVAFVYTGMQKECQDYGNQTHGAGVDCCRLYPG